MRLKSATGVWGRPADLQKRLDMRSRRSGLRSVQNHLWPVAAHLLFRRPRSNATQLGGPRRGYVVPIRHFYVNDDQKRIANAYIAQLDTAKVVPARIVTELMPLKGFYRAEDYHQDYALHNPGNPCIQVCDRPKIELLKRQFPELFVEYKGRH
jgi:hypothetical protein